MNHITKTLILSLSTLSFSWSISCMEKLLLKTIRDQKPGHITVIKKLLERDINLNYKSEEGETPLSEAIYKRQLEVAELLLEAGATTQPPSNQLSPLGTVARYGFDEFIPLLLLHGAQVNTPDASNLTPFAIAAWRGHAKCTDLLATADGDTTTLYPDNHSILSKAVSLGHIEVVKVLLKHKADPEIMDANNFTPLQGAAAKGFINIAELLLQNGANIAQPNEYNYTLAQLAAFHGKTKMLQFLLDRKPDLVNAQDYMGRSPLFWAIIRKNFEAIKYLRGKGANPNITLATEFNLLDWIKKDPDRKKLNRLLYPKKNTKKKKKASKKKKNKSNVTFSQRQEKKEGEQMISTSLPDRLQSNIPRRPLTPTKRAKNLNALIAGTTDGSYVIEDDGKTISFGYKHLEGKATDRIYRLYRDVAPVGLQLAYHPRVTEKHNNFQDGDNTYDTILHTFPESLDRMQGHCISGKFTDTEGRQITNRIFIGKKLIGNLWVEGLYILGFANIKGKLTCYHSFFNEKPFSDIMMQNISIAVSKEDKTLLANALDNIVD